ncbi:MAG: PHP domain-containing protein, partial [Paraglaciecola sp.]|nr:PHP domain-containing protein [Paraglaciecola sp.]
TPSWAINDANLIIDLHTHSTFSDGNLPISELAASAFKNGCSALAITDHANYTPAYSAERQKEIATARIEHPDMLIFNGLELNPPPYKGREHVNMITIPKHESLWMKHMQKLHQAGLKEELDPQSYFGRVVPEGLSKDDFFAIYNHPSRKDEVEEENIQDFMKWRTGSTVLSAMSGGPGHQRNSPFGSYRTFFSTINRWDPVVATTGGSWDQLLSEGHQIWGAIAVSDYHNNSMDYAPCEFARIRLTATAKTYEGVIEGLNAGTFFADQGRLFNQLKLRVVGEQTNDIYAAGSVVSSVKKQSLVSVIVEIERDDGSIALPVEVAFISNCVSGRTEEFAIKPIAAFDNQSVMTFLPIENTGSDGKSCYLRAKLSAEVNGEKLHAFTNHVRFML